MTQAGTYWCRGSGGDQVSFTDNSTAISIEKKVPNRAVVIMQHNWTQIFSGESIHVRCEIEGIGITDWEYEWRRPNSNFPSKHSELRISSATEYHSGNYMCKGTRDYYFSTEWSKAIVLTVSSHRPYAHVSANKRGLTLGDNTVTLTCSVNPPSSCWKYYWYRDDKTSKHLTKDAIFHSNGQITVSKEGYYWCRGGRGNPVYYTDFSYSFNIDRIVTYRAIVSLQPKWSVVYIGQTLYLTCEIRERKDIEWEYEWVTTSSWNPPNQHECIIKNPSPSHTGNYSCKAKLKNGLHYSTAWSDSIEVTVSDQPKPVLTVSPLWLRPGALVTLSCKVENPAVGWRFYWYKIVPELDFSYIYELLPGSSNGTGQDSYILNGQTQTAGYVCRAGRGDPVYYTHYSKEKFVWSGGFVSQASLTVHPDRVQHFTNQSGLLSCEGNSTKWRMMFSAEDSNLFHCSDWNVMTGSTCNNNSFWPRNVVYWCESGGEFSSAVNITLQDENIILVSPVHPVPKGNSVSLGCKLREEKMVSNVIFYQNDKVIQNDTRTELNISAVSKSDEGFYKCQYSGKESPPSWMTVKYDIFLALPVHPVAEGDSVTLGCKLNTGVLVYNVVFYQNDQVVQNDTGGELTLPAVSKSDEGFYKCRSSGKESPQTWMAVSVSKPWVPVLLVVGLVSGFTLFVLLLLCWFQKTKIFRCNQSQTTNQKNPSTDKRISQDETQIYCSLAHGDVCIYESLRPPGATGNVSDDLNHLKDVEDNNSDVCIYESPTHPGVTGNDVPGGDLNDVGDNSSNDDTDESSDYCNVNPYQRYDR
ncbi:hypothetical protein Q8A73_012804 [Channa argus]|nr:hypothetical protein Q8A73_012804 [Channa argus]